MTAIVPLGFQTCFSNALFAFYQVAQCLETRRAYTCNNSSCIIVVKCIRALRHCDFAAYMMLIIPSDALSTVELEAVLRLFVLAEPHFGQLNPMVIVANVLEGTFAKVQVALPTDCAADSVGRITSFGRILIQRGAEFAGHAASYR